MDQSPSQVRAGYDAVGAAYAERFSDELSGKPLDRQLLERFARAVRGAGPVCELGCGPGQIAAFLRAQGVDVRGLDLSEGVLQQARSLHPGIHFEQGDMLELGFEDGALGGVVSFYSIVHFSHAQAGCAIREMARVLQPRGKLVLSFHIGDEVLHVNEFLGRPVELDFVLFPVDVVTSALREAGFVGIEVIERDPYPDVEAQTRRAYVFAEKR